MNGLLGKIQYPKLMLLLLAIIIAYIFSKADIFEEIAYALNGHGYISMFLAGFLFTYGFTAPFAVGFFVSVAPQVNIFLAAFLAGIGALCSDLLIFRFVRHSFQDEFDKLQLSFLFQKIRNLFDNHLSDRLKQYALWAVAGFLIASPLPDEFGVSLVSGFTQINQKIFSLISFCLNTAGIFVILALAA